MVNIENLITSNSYYKLKTINVDGVLIKDPNQIEKLPKIDIEKLGLNVNYYTMSDNEMIDGVSFKLYNTPQYWDILMAINGIKSIDYLPKDNDIVYFRAQKIFLEKQEILKKIKFEVYQKDLDELFENILQEQKELNEKFRNIKYVIPSDLSDILNYYNENYDKIKLNENLLINNELEGN